MKRFLLLLSCIATSVMSFAQVTSISVEAVYTDDGSVAGYPAGHTTYRIYANCTSPTDLISQIQGNSAAPLSLQVPGGIWNNSNGGPLVETIDCSLFQFDASLEYDSYLTIGKVCNSDAGSPINRVEALDQPWIDAAFSTTPYGSSSISVNTAVGGAWYSLPTPTSTNLYAGADLQILLAQITTSGTICGVFQVQAFPQYSGPNSPYQVQTIAFGTDNCGTPGCTNPDALNYDATAGYDDGRCILPCSLANTVTTIQPTCAASLNGAFTIHSTGNQDLVQFSLNGGSFSLSNTGIYTSSSYGNGTYTVVARDSRFYNEAYNPGGVYGTCEVTETITLNTLPIVFGSVSSTPISCSNANDGCISSSATGGTGTLSFAVGTNTNLTTASYCGLGAGAFHVTATDANGCTAQTSNVVFTNPAQLTLFSGAGSATTCPGDENGQRVITWAGGTGDVDFSMTAGGPYDIEGNPSNAVMTGAAGSYTLYAADANGCTATLNYTIAGPAAFEVASTPIEPSCIGLSDGSFNVNVVGGTGAILYSLDNVDFNGTHTYTGLPAGTYTVYFHDGSNCAGSADVVITDPTAVAATAAGTDITCNGLTDGSVSVVAEGGSGTYVYSLDGGVAQGTPDFGGLAAGCYAIQVSDSHGCTYDVAEPVCIVEPTAFSSDATSTNALCDGSANGTITMTSNGGTMDYIYSIDGSAYTSNPSFSGLAAGTYTISSLDAHQCEDVDVVTITAPGALVISGLVADNINDTPGGSSPYSVTGGTPAYTYEWTNSIGAVVSTVAALGPFTNASDAGTYNLTVTDANGCTQTASITITGLDEVTRTYEVSLSPNPTTEMFRLNILGLAGERLTYNVTDAQGRIVARQELGNASGNRVETVNVSNLAAGVYLVNVFVGDSSTTLKLIKE